MYAAYGSPSTNNRSYLGDTLSFNPSRTPQSSLRQSSLRDHLTPSRARDLSLHSTSASYSRVSDPYASLTPRGYSEARYSASLTPGGPGLTPTTASVRPSSVGPSVNRTSAYSYDSATPRTNLSRWDPVPSLTRTTEVVAPVARSLDYNSNRAPSATAQPAGYTHHGSPARGSRYQSSFGEVTYVNDDEYTSYERPGSPARLDMGGSYAAHDSGRIGRMPSMNKERGWAFLPRATPQDAGKLVVVLDLDETLVYARDGYTVVRPGARELLRHLKGRCELLVWTAGERDYAQSVIREIDTTNAVQHCVYRHPKWWTGQPGYTKNLEALGRPLDRTIIVDNTPDCLRSHPRNSILVSDFLGKQHEGTDRTLYILMSVFDDLIRCAQVPVPQALDQNQDVACRTVRCDAGGSISVFTLAKDSHLGSTAYESSRYNRDLSLTPRGWR